MSAAAGLALAPILGAATAQAHVVARTAGMEANGFGVVTFMVPNESDTAATTELRVTFPAVKHLLPEHKDGWAAHVAKNADGAVTEIRWTAQPGTPGIPVGEFTEFNVAGGPFTGDVVLPAVQRYSDGSSVAWDQRAGADGQEPEHPAPTITVAAAQSAATSDHTARWLGSLGLLAGIAGIGIGGASVRSRREAPTKEKTDA
ncbi:YcnI family copper-binding membrane protein [Gordonia crocea]|uniref:YcnI family copper-binding membrane protein n=1 Tax=Gordonia crocea TaxID=589162 RepID=UPI001E41E588|nr:YcnI family protein [Gordonia crocea]